MIRTRVAVTVAIGLLVGCGFHPRGRAADDDVGEDAGEDVDDGGARGDAAPVDPIDAVAVPQVCTLAASAAATPGPVVGSASGGSPRADLGCSPGELPIGVAFDVSDGTIANHGGQRVVVAVHLRCGAIRATDGVYAVTPTTVASQPGGNGGNCGSYAAVTRTGEVVCPAATALVGMTFNHPDDVLFNTVALRCAGLAPDGTVGSTITSQPIAGTGDYSNDPGEAVCPAGTAVVAITPNSGCGIDGLTLRCAPLACGPA